MADEWNVNKPINHTLVSALPEEIRKLKTSTKTQIDREHETPIDGDATGGEHSNGSAVAYKGTVTPSNRPDGVTALAANDVDYGRLWIDDNLTQVPIKRWNGSAWVVTGMSPSAYTGQQSVILPNGMIMKMGAFTVGSNPDTVTFAAAFPNNIVSVTVTAVHSTQPGYYLTAYSKTAFTGIGSSAQPTTVLWTAIGY